MELVRGDITTLEVDAIINAASSELRGGGVVEHFTRIVACVLDEDNLTAYLAAIGE